jgi:multidrug resistance efflux pump
MKVTPQLLRRLALPIGATGLIGFAILTLSPPDKAGAAPPAAPASAPESQGSVVAALGLIEPSSEVIEVGSELSGVVREVFVKPGDQVSAGAPLFRLDDRALGANLEAQRAAADQARANSAASASRVPGLQANAANAAAGIAQAEAGVTTARGTLTQAEGRLASARAAADAAQLAFADAQARLGLYTNLSDPRAVSTDERDRARFAMERAKAASDQARAAVTEAEGGLLAARGGLGDAQARLAAARATSASARASVSEGQQTALAARAGAAQAQAQAKVAATDLDRLTVRAPIAGQVLRLNIRVGEFASAGPLADPLVAMGAVNPMHVRVQIDEEDAARVAAGAPAQGSLRGDATRRIPLTFVRFEPQALPKKNLNGGAERVDTRVVEAIYAFNPAGVQAFVGQQMDVFVTARPIKRAETTKPAAGNGK